MKKIYLIGLTFVVLVLPKVGQAATSIKTLNGLSATDQVFVNDTNLKITSSGSSHALGWNGFLSPLRGGLGIDASTFAAGSIPFFDGTNFAENNNYFWDNTNNVLNASELITSSVSGGVLNGQSSLQFSSGATSLSGGNGPGDGSPGGGINITGGSGNDSSGGDIYLYGGVGKGNHYGGQINILGGNTDYNGSGSGGTINITSGSGGSSEGGAPGNINVNGGFALTGSRRMGGTVTIVAGDGDGPAPGGDGYLSAGNGGSDGEGGGAYLIAGNAGGGDTKGGDIILQPGNKSGSGSNGRIIVPIAGGTGASAVFTFDLINAGDKTFTFPNASGTFPLLGIDQEFLGVNTFSNPVNNFISGSSSTVHIGADGIPGCIVMGDSDSSGVTYITANDGVISASSTLPASCN